jgi:hypothetical protein
MFVYRGVRSFNPLVFRDQFGIDCKEAITVAFRPILPEIRFGLSLDVAKLNPLRTGRNGGVYMPGEVPT